MSKSRCFGFLFGPVLVHIFDATKSEQKLGEKLAHAERTKWRKETRERPRDRVIGQGELNERGKRLIWRWTLRPDLSFVWECRLDSLVKAFLASVESCPFWPRKIRATVIIRDSSIYCLVVIVVQESERASEREREKEIMVHILEKW